MNLKVKSNGINFNVPTIENLPTERLEEGLVCVVTDENRGGVFVYREANALANNGGTIFNGWTRQYDGAVNVKWFGAKGDGVTDDTAAIKFVCENFNDIEGDIEDTYKVVTTTFGSSNYDGIQISSNTKIKKLNIYCTGFIPSGIHTEIPSLFKLIDAQNVTIEGCSFDSSSELDARITSFEKGVYTYIAISSTVDYGSSNIKILNNKFSKNLGSCVGGFPSPIDGLSYYKSDIVVSNNHFYDVGNHCFSMEKGYNNIVSNNTMNNQIGTQFTGYVVGAFCDFSQGTVSSICTGNICNGVQTGVKTESDGYLNNYSENNIISNNIFINFKGEGSATSNYGIQLNGVLDRAFGNTIKLGVNPTTGVATTTLIIGLKAQSGAYKCVFDNNKVDVNGVGVWCYAQNEPSNLSFLKITNNIVSCASSLAIQFIDARNIFISGNNLTGTTDLISATGNNFTIINNILNTTSPSVGAIYLNEPNINISAYVFNISNNTINIETSGATVGFNTIPSLPYEKVTMVGNTITSKANENVIQLFSTNSLVFSNNIININNPTQTTDRRCLMLRSSTYVCVDAVITGNILHNNGTSFGNAIFGEFRNSIIANNSLKSFNACINLDGGQNTSIMNNSYAGSSIASALGTGTVSLNNIVKI